eukprot:265487-Rhodomonas_salina.1
MALYEETIGYRLPLRVDVRSKMWADEAIFGLVFHILLYSLLFFAGELLWTTAEGHLRYIAIVSRQLTLPLKEEGFMP